MGHILRPAIQHSLERRDITEEEAKVLDAALTASGAQVKAGDLAQALPGLTASQRTRRVAKLVDGRMLMPIAPKARVDRPGLMACAMQRRLPSAAA